METLGGVFVHSLRKTSLSARIALLLKHFPKLVRHAGFFFRERREFMRCLVFYAQLRDIAVTTGIDAVAAYHIFPSGLIAAWLSEDLGVPFLTTVFGEIYEDPERFRRSRRETAFVLGSSRKLLSCSAHCAASTEILGFSLRVDPLYYGIDTSTFVPLRARDASRHSLGLPVSVHIVTFVARHTREMGLQVFIDAARVLLKERTGVVFHIAGRRGEMTDDALAFASEYPGAVHVSIDLPGAQLVATYQSSDVVVVPSINLRACLGLAIIEAMACGKPVVVSEVGGGPEVLGNSEVGLLVQPGDASATARAVRQLIDDPALAARLGENGRVKAVREFDVTVTNRSMESFLAGLGK
jgi:glycosyltransferase involved in cell wall biosynthesis